MMSMQVAADYKHRDFKVMEPTLSARTTAASLCAPEHHALMLWAPCAGGGDSARHTRRRRRCEAASDVGAHNRSLSPSWPRAGAAAV